MNLSGQLSDQDTVRIYVGNIPFSTSEQELRDLFSDHGQVVSTAIITDRHTGQSRGFGFVEMGGEAEGMQAIEALHQYPLEGRPLVVNKARPRTGGRRGGSTSRWRDDRW